MNAKERQDAVLDRVGANAEILRLLRNALDNVALLRQGLADMKFERDIQRLSAEFMAEENARLRVLLRENDIEA